MLRHRIGHEFTNPALLVQALAHRSWCAEHATLDQPAPPSNERLEYLGDAVLGAIVADYVYRSYPDLPEGQLTDRLGRALPYPSDRRAAGLARHRDVAGVAGDRDARLTRHSAAVKHEKKQKIMKYTGQA